MRHRINLTRGTLASGISDSDTVVSSAAFSDLPEITGGSGAILALTIDPEGAAEIVHITAHDSAATSATVERGAEGSTAVAHSAADKWVHAPTVEDFRFVVNTDGDPGVRIYVGTVEPDGITYPLEVGDVWLDTGDA